jgi:hypothetical protein
MKLGKSDIVVDVELWRRSGESKEILRGDDTVER